MSYLNVSGELVRPNALEISKATDLALSLLTERIDFARLVECRRRDGFEVVVFDVDVEIAQEKRYPIRACERISASFRKKDDMVPMVHALRKDFPRVPHLNLHRQEYPRNMCLYEEPYEEIKRCWTSPRFVHDIRRWLALTSQGKLHQDDQPLEPLLIDFHGHIVVPSTVLLEECSPVCLSIREVGTVDGIGSFFVAETGEPKDGSEPMLVSVHRCDPQKHGVIYRMPTTLADLANITAQAGVDLISDLRNRLQACHSDDSSVLDAHILLVILFPKMRQDKGTTEVVESRAFFLSDTEGDRRRCGPSNSTNSEQK